MEIESSFIISNMSLNVEVENLLKSTIHDLKTTWHPEESELIIIDNASTHGTDMMTQEAHTYVHLKKNQGWGGGLNVGMKLAKGKYFVFVNNDIILKPGFDWHAKIKERFETVPKTGAISIHNRDGFSGSFFAIRREVYNEIGGFDEINYPLGYCCDADFLYRMLLTGFDIFVINIKEYFWHHGRRTYDQPKFKDEYGSHVNFRKAPFFKEKYGIDWPEWEKHGHQQWRKFIEKNPLLDRFDELKNER